MNEPIISPWMIYWITRLDSIKDFFEAFAVVSFIVGLAFLAGVFMNIDRVWESEKKWFDINLRAFKILAVTFCVSLTFSTFLPTTKTAVAMYVTSKITPQTVQQAGETIDQITDKIVDKIIKIKEAK